MIARPALVRIADIQVEVNRAADDEYDAEHRGPHRRHPEREGVERRKEDHQLLHRVLMHAMVALENFVTGRRRRFDAVFPARLTDLDTEIEVLEQRQHGDDGDPGHY